MPIIAGQVLDIATVYNDSRKAYDGLIPNGYKHNRDFHSQNDFAIGKCHINGTESFWSFAKRRLAQFNGINAEKFILHLGCVDTNLTK